jgi:hypothetical protein
MVSGNVGCYLAGGVKEWSVGDYRNVVCWGGGQESVNSTYWFCWLLFMWSRTQAVCTVWKL